VKKAGLIEDVQKLLVRIDEASHDLKDHYYVLFDNLNALFESYPQLYKEIQMTVKLPTNDDAKNIVQFYDDLHGILTHFQDEQYLNSFINPEPETAPDADEQEQSTEIPELK
jgi:hypothetical protein